MARDAKGGARPPGIYDELVTRELEAALARLPSELCVTAEVDPHHAPRAIGRLLASRIVAVLAGLRGDDRVAQQVDLANRVVELLRSVDATSVAASDRLAEPARELQAILAPAVAPAVARAPERPSIPLSSSDLLVNGPHDLNLGPEVRRELASADRVDLLCSFVKYTGFRILEHELRDLVRRRGARTLRVLTTAYMMATDRRALDALVELGAVVRVSYDTARTRLHAKAWLFHRDSGFSTACVGSSNLSASAMLDGLEWNVRLSAVDNGAILDKFASTFEQYWADPIFRAYDPDEFDAAVQRGRRFVLAPYLFLDVAPRPHQAEVLEQLAAERSRGHRRNLVVAATGTGKTIVAALDYKRLRGELPRDRLLFVAHRREILEQSLSTFRVVLRDGAFGELFVAGERPDRWEHVFASVQSLTQEMLETLPKDAFDVVIVDEFHHAAAKTYDTLLAHLEPRVLVGLTATPERADGKSILHHFDGRIASELRLWKALDQGLLCPFHYFGVGGGPDLRGVKWSRGRYDAAALSNVYTADHLFALRVIQEVHAKVTDATTMRALGFCVDVAHATFMAGAFEKAGLRAAVVSGSTPAPVRAARLAELRAGELRCLFSVDLFNEGVDLPDVDTLLFLRPTESATIFLQQLGRGLRNSDKKDCLTVLDFIGDAHRQFRFDRRYRALVGGTRRTIEQQIERGFPSLPSGCMIQLDRQAQEAVLENVRSQLGVGVRGLIDDLRGLGDVSLAAFLEHAGIDLEDLYSNGRCFTTLRRAAGFEAVTHGVAEPQFARAFARMLHLDDPFRLDGIRAMLRGAEPPAADDADPLQRALFVLLGYVRQPFSALAEAWRALWQARALREELAALLEVLDDRVRHVVHPLTGGLAAVPLWVHATYSLDEVLAAFDERTKDGGVKRIQTGVFQAAAHRTDLLFVTLEKSERDYSPTTLYKDFAISPTRFHWESQSSAHAGTPTGQRYLRSTREHAEAGAGQVLLFVRARNQDARGETTPYTLLGEVYCAAHRGARPMQIEWDLAVPMPAGMYSEMKIAAG